MPEWGWEKLSSLYRGSPLLNLDEMALTGSSNSQPPSDDWEDMPEPEIIEQQPEQQTAQQKTLPLPPRKKAKSRALQIHCRTVLKELISATYLIRDEKCLQRLAEDIDALYEKTKKMTPSEGGVAIEELKNTDNKRDTVSDSDQKRSNTVPLPPQTHGAKKHPANGRFGSKAEWQRRFVRAKTKSSRPRSTNRQTPLKRPVSQDVSGPPRKKAKAIDPAPPATKANEQADDQSNVQEAAQSPSVVGM